VICCQTSAGNALIATRILLCYHYCSKNDSNVGVEKSGMKILTEWQTNDLTTLTSDYIEFPSYGHQVQLQADIYMLALRPG
jgi:hypothetical protein